MVDRLCVFVCHPCLASNTSLIVYPCVASTTQALDCYDKAASLDGRDINAMRLAAQVCDDAALDSHALLWYNRVLKQSGAPTAQDFVLRGWLHYRRGTHVHDAFSILHVRPETLIMSVPSASFSLVSTHVFEYNAYSPSSCWSVVAFAPSRFLGTSLIQRIITTCLSLSLIPLLCCITQLTGVFFDAINDFIRAVALQPTTVQGLYGQAVTWHVQGAFSKAIALYDRVLAIDADHRCHFLRDLAVAMGGKLDTRRNEWILNTYLTPWFKECLCKKQPASSLQGASPTLQPPTVVRADVEHGEDAHPDRLALLSACHGIGALMAAPVPGVLYSHHHQRMFGLAVVDMAQFVRRCLQSSTYVVSGLASCHSGTLHAPGWRDLVDIFVQWRSCAEPNEPTFWLDEFTPECVAEGFALQTGMFFHHFQSSTLDST